MNSSSKRIVIYHANCVDGFTAAWCAWQKFGDDAEYLPANYGDRPPEALGLDVLILDFTYPRRELEYMAKVADSIRVLDHHKTAREDLEGLDFALFDMDRSGAGIAWDELHGAPRPKLVDYVEDRDLWRWELPASKEISAWIASWDMDDFRPWSLLLGDLEASFHDCHRQGSALLRAVEKHVKSQTKLAGEIGIAGHRVPCINCTYGVSELVGKLAEAAPFAVGWFQRADGMFVYSLRSRGDFDVSAVARQFGGGGHRNAAGFTVKEMVHR